ncbi:DUF1593 domain-containing protein [Pareuzebyella sediminis]|uniref:DUF1593 domain-containing protein n=1 Tax=Pareuzebyella sediminis TaxID=2607998 RepID=UPI0018E15208|nr:DUF1593 domain-containing protein [Pareuzebyella sediminis]
MNRKALSVLARSMLFCLTITSIFIACTDRTSRPRVLVSTDIGGSDPDDYQSLVHLFLYADTLDIVGLISSPPDKGRKKHILETIAVYEKDYPKLKKKSPSYPSPEYLRSVTAQGAIQAQAAPSPDNSISEGAKLIISEAEKGDQRPLYILIWGAMTDLAQALHKAPHIKPNIRAYYIGSWNTRQDSLSRNYVYQEHPDLWFIENNSTFRGMYMGGYQLDDYGNEAFVKRHIQQKGHLGRFFFQKKKDIKMGDTPSVLYLLHGNPENPESESWGGRFQKTGHGTQYWTDRTQTEYIENGKPGAKTVNKWRKEYLNDWKKRLDYLQ